MKEPIGHDRAKTVLAQTRPQALLLTGPEGVGRRAMARWFAYGLNCERGFPPCGRCESCRLDPHPDYLEIGPQTGERQRPVIPVERIVPREGGGENLLEWIEAAPHFRRKVAVIDGADRLTEAAANALLKTLEEPPGHAHVVLVAASRDAVLPTLASRSLEVRLSPLPESRLRSITDDPDLLAFAEGAPGRLFWALEHPDEVRDLVRLVDALLLGLSDGQASAERLKELLARARTGLSPWPFFRRAFAKLPADARAEALAFLVKLVEAHEAFVAPELLAAWGVHELRRIYGNLRPRAL